MSDEDSVVKGYDACIAAHGKVDIVVNAAGIVGPNGVKTADLEVADFDKVCVVM